MDIELGRRILERYFLEPDEAVREISDFGQVAIFDTNSVPWRIDRVEDIGSTKPNPAYTLYHVAINMSAEPPPPPDGIAVLPDGTFFHLNEVLEFRAFWLRVRERVEPVELAVLLVHYLSESPRNQNPVLKREDLSWLIDEHQIESIADFTLPQSRIDDKGSLTLDFCTFYIEQVPPNFVHRVGLNRWHVEADTEGYLDWTIQPIAGGLSSPRYSIT
jgi:hypothetical protein